MTLIVLTVLATAWLGYFVLWLRERRAAQPLRTDGMGGFSPTPTDTGRVSALPIVAGRGAKPRGEFLEAPRSPQQALNRRRQVATLLAAVAVISLVGVPVFGATALAVHVLADMALLLFAFAVRRQQAATPNMAEVRLLYPERLAPADAAATPLRRVVNG